MDTPAANPYVSRGGLKLRAALDAFAIDVRNLTCADLGCSTGGFTDCLLQAGAARVHAVDTAYGQLAWKIRNDPRVVVMERTNALFADPPEPVDLVVIDLGWTPQTRAVPAALRWLKPARRIITLIKPHYEIPKPEFARLATRGVLPDDAAERIAAQTIAALPALGVKPLGAIRSPIRGGEGGKGNLEWLALLSK